MAPDVQTARCMAQDHCAAWTDHRPNVFAARYAEQATMIMNGGDPLTGRSLIADMVAGFMTEFPDLVLSLETEHVADHHIVYAWAFTGCHKDTGNQVRYSGWEEWDLDDNLNVIRSLVWYDSAGYERQVAGN